jgi:hypothetical protein
MATPLRTRRIRRAVRQEFAGLEITGALLTPDMVAKIASGEAPDQGPESYGVPAGLKLRDEIARYYRIAEALWSRFNTSRTQNESAAQRFVVDLLKQCFGFDALETRQAVQVGEREFPVRHAALKGRVPVVIAPAAGDGAHKSGVDESLALFADGPRRRSATLLLQEFLNAQEAALWGLASDGLTLRLMRDNVSLTRPAWIEANLAKIFSEGLFPDFSALWLLIHQSRFGASQAAPSDCSLEKWRERGRTDGVAARDKLRQGVEAALLELGQGFIEHRANAQLLEALSSGRISSQAFYEELLRLIYRLIFLFAAEDRGLLHAPNVSSDATKTYAEGYSLGRLRERAMRRAAWDRHGDGWEGLKTTFAALKRGEVRLGLPALGGLFSDNVLANLEACRIENRRLLSAIWRLAWMRPDGQPLTRVNWRDMETEELGSVYESLLELKPLANASNRTLTFASEDEAKGNARKTSGSYYTPDSLVKLLLDTTLDPVLDAAEARNPQDPVSEILKLTIIDPACGSGHFLLGAARRVASRVARLRSSGVPGQDEFQHALRDVVTNCIYGTDRNPLAVELCKVALWIEAIEPGKPLTFLDSHIRCGDSLVGVFSIESLRHGIPDEAYKQLAGDEKDVAKAYATHNKSLRDGAGATGMLAEFRPPAELVNDAQAIMQMPENSVEEVAAKKTAFARLQSSSRWLQLRLACDCHIAAFFAPKTGTAPTARDIEKTGVPVTSHIWAALRGADVPEAVSKLATNVSARVSAFHWPLEFPHVFGRGGFDVIAGNPPWERIKLQEQEFFASRSPDIATAANAAERTRLIQRLALLSPGTPGRAIWEEYQFAKRAAEATSEFVRNGGRFPLTGTGDVNTYALFAEHFSNLVRPEGRAGVIVPTGIATDSSTSAFFGNLVINRRLAALIDFENREAIFASVHRSYKFSILSMGAAPVANFAFFLTNAQQLEDTERRFTLSSDQIARINPNTKTAPVFRSRADAELTAKIYGRVPVLVEERPAERGGDLNPWGVSFQTMFHMSGDSELFMTASQFAAADWTMDGADWVKGRSSDPERYVPLYEAKMIHHYDHRWATYTSGAVDEETGARDCTLAEKQNPNYEPTPRYWVPEAEVRLRAARLPANLKRAWREEHPDRCLKALAEYLAGYFTLGEGRQAGEEDLKRTLGRDRDWRTALGKTPDAFLREPKTLLNGTASQRETPLTKDDIAFLCEGPGDVMQMVEALVERKQPRWLMGWRDICRATDERTVIASVFPLVGAGNKIPMIYSTNALTPKALTCLLGGLSSICGDYVARQKIGGTTLNYFLLKQISVLPPDAFSAADHEFVSSRTLELSYSSVSMKSFAEDLGYTGKPFRWDEDRRATLRAELDAFFARKFGLTRDELRYVLDPADVRGDGYPSETFRVLKNSETRAFGEYRTQRLVLAAFDRLTGG